MPEHEHRPVNLRQSQQRVPHQFALFRVRRAGVRRHVIDYLQVHTRAIGVVRPVEQKLAPPSNASQFVVTPWVFRFFGSWSFAYAFARQRC